LQYVRAVIHHGGIGTLNQALAAAVPQLVLAFGHDRPDNGARLQRLGVGECLPPAHWRPGPVAEALRRLWDPRVQERCNHLLLKQVNTIDPAVAACDIIDYSCA
jgi:rhamnosyltransferase subunit B